MSAPVHRLKKAEVNWLGGHRCAHGHTYLEHYDCFLKDYPERQPKIGHFDIETSGLNASYGIVLCYCIQEENSDKIWGRRITKNELRTCLDYKVIKACVRDLKRFDIVTTYFGTGFDLKFIRSVALMMDIPFPHYSTIQHIDLYYVVKNKLKLHNNKLKTACSMLLGTTEKTEIDPHHWKKAIHQGDKKALEYIYDHCKRDVRDTKRLYHKIIDYRYPGLRSI